MKPAAVMLAGALLLASRAWASPPEVAKAEALAREAVSQGSAPSIAMALARHGRMLYAGAFGDADREQGLRATPETPYPLASATKPIVATAILRLAEQRRLSLDAPAPGALPEVFRATNRNAPLFTVRQLLNHTSGLGTYAHIVWSDRPDVARPLADTFARYGFAAQPPGLVCEYSNLGYGLLGAIVEQASGAELATYLEREIFRPLGMRHASLPARGTLPARAAQKYDDAGSRLPDSWNDTPGAGNLYASAVDLVRFGSFHLGSGPARGSSVLSERAREQMRSYVDPDALYHYYDGAYYGLGWYFRDASPAGRIVWHEGGMPGASALLVLLPQPRIVVAVLINTTDANPLAQRLATELVKAFAPAAPELIFDAAAGYSRYAGETSWRGTWNGSARFGDRDVALNLALDAQGKALAEFPDPAARAHMPAVTSFTPLVRDRVLLATLPFVADAPGVDRTRPGFLLLRLVRTENDLRGTAVAYATDTRLEHLYPFAVALRRAPRDGHLPRSGAGIAAQRTSFIAPR
jgi:CubicO group peptidase (beta-lactamase class C family)